MSNRYISSSPHFSAGLSTQKIMLAVIIALLPECAAGVYFFGLKALAVILTSVASCFVFELLFQIVTKQKVVVSNLSAVVTGILLALVCSPEVPVWMIIIGSAVAVIVAKGLFGGIGSNVFNPALTGRAFLFISFPAAMGATWYDPQLVPHIYEKLTAAGKSAAEIDAMSQATVWDGITSATVLSKVKAGTFNADGTALWNLFIGNRGGCIGETSVLMILISFVFLFAIRVIDWRATVSMCLTVAAATFIASLSGAADAVKALRDALTAVMTGGLLFGAVFMVTDYATAPVTSAGRLIFGAGCGLITFLIRRFGGYPEGVMFSILIMNAFAPFLNNLTGRMYGYGKKGHRRPVPAKIVQEFDTENAVTKVTSEPEESK